MILSPSNLKKTVAYFKRNGFKNTIYASYERILEKKNNKYEYIEPDEAELKRQREYKFANEPLISIVVPCYETKPVYLEDLILSCEEQTYQKFELVIADASETDFVERICRDFNGQYGNIVYKRLEENNGISDNTNEGIMLAGGEYTGLLDHDDILTRDALFNMVKAINGAGDKNIDPLLLYSDEDKTDTYLEKYYEPHKKGRFDRELIMTNNYVCHFALYRTEVLKELKLRKEFDGAQDYDLVLRTFEYSEDKYGIDAVKYIIHVPGILYHWRCHATSTADNPVAKQYAYENGRKALEEYAKRKWPSAIVSHLKHVGFYRVDYPDGVLETRQEVAAVGGPVYEKGKIVSGMLNKQGKAMFEGLNKNFSGYMHGAALKRETDVLDIRNICIRDKYKNLFKKETGFSYPLSAEDKIKETNDYYIKKSVKFCNKLKQSGIILIYDPQFGVDKE